MIEYVYTQDLVKRTTKNFWKLFPTVGSWALILQVHFKQKYTTSFTYRYLRVVFINIYSFLRLLNLATFPWILFTIRKPFSVTSDKRKKIVIAKNLISGNDDDLKSYFAAIHHPSSVKNIFNSVVWKTLTPYMSDENHRPLSYLRNDYLILRIQHFFLTCKIKTR